MAIIVFLLLHWYLSLFGQTFYLHRYSAHKMFTMSKFWEKFWYIYTWIPELASIPSNFIHEPWKMSVMEQELCKTIIGVDYPAPIVDVEFTRKYASDQVWGLKKTSKVKKEAQRILKKHVNT